MYDNSLDRKHVVAVLEDASNAHWNCTLQYRAKWKPSETKQSAREYKVCRAVPMHA